MYQDRVIIHLRCVEVPINQVSNFMQVFWNIKIYFDNVFKLEACFVHKMMPLTATKFVEACPIKQEVLYAMVILASETELKNVARLNRSSLY